MLCGLFFSPFAVQANDKVETVYNAQKFQQVCKGKTQGAPVSFAYRGIIWNGTCEPQFFSSSKAIQLQGNEPELYRSCAADAQSTEDSKILLFVIFPFISHICAIRIKNKDEIL